MHSYHIWYFVFVWIFIDDIKTIFILKLKYEYLKLTSFRLFFLLGLKFVLVILYYYSHSKHNIFSLCTAIIFNSSTEYQNFFVFCLFFHPLFFIVFLEIYFTFLGYFANECLNFCVNFCCLSKL